MGLFSIQLNSEEEALTIIRRHWHTFFWSLVRSLIIAAIALSIYAFFPENRWRLIITMLIGAVALTFFFYNLVVWYLVSLVVTSQRIIDINQVGLTKRVVTEVALRDISRISALKEGLFQNLFNVGALVFDVREGGRIVFFGVKKPEELMSRINVLRHQKQYASQGEERTL